MPKTIYVVDDEKNIRQIIRSYLEKEGYVVAEFENGEDALAGFNSAMPDMLIIDIMMQHEDGVQVLRKIIELGLSEVEDELEETLPEYILEKYQEYKKGYNNIYINYYVSGNAESRKFVNVKNNQGEPGGFFGPELGMAEKLNELYPDQIFFIIKYTCSGTNLNEQWLSPSSKGKKG